MYQFKEINDGELWDQFATTFPRASFIVSWSWGEFMRQTGVNYSNIGVYEDGDLVGLLPIAQINAKRGSYLHLRHSPLIDWENIELVQECIVYLRELASQKGVWFVRISPMLRSTPENNQLLREFGLKPATAHEVDAESTLILDLTKNEEQLLSEMRKNTRYYIRKAEKMGVTTERVEDSSKFEIFWEIFSDAVERNQWVAFSKDYLKREFETFAAAGQSSMFLCKYKGEHISAAIFTYFNKQSFYHHSGSLTKYREIPSAYLLQWEAIKYAKSRGCTEHNLWGVVDKDLKSHPWYGLSLFKWGFGGEKREMVHAHDLVVKPLAHATRIFELIERKRRGY